MSLFIQYSYMHSDSATRKLVGSVFSPLHRNEIMNTAPEMIRRGSCSCAFWYRFPLFVARISISFFYAWLRCGNLIVTIGSSATLLSTALMFAFKSTRTKDTNLSGWIWHCCMLSFCHKSCNAFLLIVHFSYSCARNSFQSSNFQWSLHWFGFGRCFGGEKCRKFGACQKIVCID